MDPDRTATPSRFPATRWTLVGRAGGLDAETGPIAIAEIVRLYVPALRAHLMHRMQCDEHRADDLLQGFLTDKVLEQRLIGYADPKRGRFRTFLLTALERYVIDTQRRAAAQKRSPQASVKDIDDHIEDLKHPEADREQSSEFDLAWAKEVVDEVLATMRQQCEQTSRLDLWEVFDVRYLKPAMDGSEPEPHESIADRLKLESAHQSGNLLISAKRMFTRVFMNVVSRYTADEAEMRDEVNDLWRVFAQART
jgi:RNA polymerase sigma-70 factor (ECF subfamily)